MATKTAEKYSEPCEDRDEGEYWLAEKNKDFAKGNFTGTVISFKTYHCSVG